MSFIQHVNKCCVVY